MGFRETVLNAQEYADAETTSLASFGTIPPTTPKFTTFKAATINPDGTAAISIEPGHGDRLFDAGVVFFFELAIELGAARLRLNSRGPNKAAGRDNIYPRLDISGRLRLNMQVSRLVADPSPGRRVRENPTDHRNYLREGLRSDENPMAYGPGKARTTRWDAIEAILEAYDRAPEESRAAITRTSLERLLTGLLVLADARASERQMMTMKRTA